MSSVNGNGNDVSVVNGNVSAKIRGREILADAVVAVADDRFLSVRLAEAERAIVEQSAKLKADAELLQANDCVLKEKNALLGQHERERDKFQEDLRVLKCELDQQIQRTENLGRISAKSTVDLEKANAKLADAKEEIGDLACCLGESKRTIEDLRRQLELATRAESKAQGQIKVRQDKIEILWTAMADILQMTQFSWWRKTRGPIADKVRSTLKETNKIKDAE